VPTLRHAAPDHDEATIVRLAAADLDAQSADLARARVSACPACAELLADLRALAAATAALPAPRRSSDFRLTEADAARLRPIAWRRLLGLLNGPSLAFTRPLATGLATLGIVGLLVAALPGGLGLGGAATVPTAGGNVAESGAAVGAPAAAAPLAPGARPGADATPGGFTALGPSQVPGAAGVAGAPNPASSAPVTAGPAGAATLASPPESMAPSPGLTTDLAPAKGLGSAAPSDAALRGATASGPPIAPAPAAVTPTAPSNPGPSPLSPLAILSIGLLAVGLGLAGLRWAAHRLA
jgi:hypothetical protein